MLCEGRKSHKEGELPRSLGLRHTHIYAGSQKGSEEKGTRVAQCSGHMSCLGERRFHAPTQRSI